MDLLVQVNGRIQLRQDGRSRSIEINRAVLLSGHTNATDLTGQTLFFEPFEHVAQRLDPHIRIRMHPLRVLSDNHTATGPVSRIAVVEIERVLLK